MSLIVTFIIILFILSTYSLVLWIVHLTESPFDKVHGWAGYIKFSKQMKRYEWEHKGYRGLVDKNEPVTYSQLKTYVRIGDEIKFDGIYMTITNPISYLFVILRYMKEKKKFRQKTVVHKW